MKTHSLHAAIEPSTDLAKRGLLAVLRGEASVDTAIGTAGGMDGFVHAARYHGVMPMLHARFRGGDPSQASTSLAATCRSQTLADAAHELAHRAELARVLPALDRAGVRALLLKGTALAYSLYRSPALRPRADTDLLIPPGGREAAADVLAGLGYVSSQGAQGEFVSYQATWNRTDRYGATHSLDVHWRINNSQMLAGMLGYEELAARAVPIARLGPCAFGLSAVHALLIACIHRAGHAHAPYVVDGVPYQGGDRIIWLYDIHLLVGSMSAAELDEFAALASSRRIKALCREALERSSEYFGTPLAPSVMAALAAPGPVEPTSRYFGGGALWQMWGDLLALNGWRERTRWLRETALPGERYMRSKYPDAATAWLPWLYARRALGGVWRRMFPGGRPAEE